MISAPGNSTKMASSTSSDTACALDQGHVAVELQMELDEGRLARGAGAQIMQIAHLRIGQRDLADLAPRGIGQFAIHQQVEGASGDPPGRIQDVEADAGGKDRIGQRPAELAPQQQRDDDRAVDQQVAEIVERIRLDGDGTGRRITWR